MTDEITGEVEFREAQVQDVSFPRRTIELVVMPYERETEVAYRGRVISEIVSRGAYDGVEKRTSQIKVNRGHLIDAVVGKTLALHPSRAEGLIAELRISRTPLGEETLVLADDGILAASAGFALMRENGRSGPVKRDAEVWESRDRRRLNHLWLDHIAMTPDPAYDDARVLAVRTADQPPPDRPGDGTPNLDRLAHDELRARFEEMNRRWLS